MPSQSRADRNAARESPPGTSAPRRNINSIPIAYTFQSRHTNKLLESIVHRFSALVLAEDRATRLLRARARAPCSALYRKLESRCGGIIIRGAKYRKTAQLASENREKTGLAIPRARGVFLLFPAIFNFAL